MAPALASQADPGSPPLLSCGPFTDVERGLAATSRCSWLYGLRKAAERSGQGDFLAEDSSGSGSECGEWERASDSGESFPENLGWDTDEDLETAVGSWNGSYKPARYSDTGPAARPVAAAGRGRARSSRQRSPSVGRERDSTPDILDASCLPEVSGLGEGVAGAEGAVGSLSASPPLRSSSLELAGLGSASDDLSSLEPLALAGSGSEGGGSGVLTGGFYGPMPAGSGGGGGVWGSGPEAWGSSGEAEVEAEAGSQVEQVPDSEEGESEGEQLLHRRSARPPAVQRFARRGRLGGPSPAGLEAAGEQEEEAGSERASEQHSGSGDATTEPLEEEAETASGEGRCGAGGQHPALRCAALCRAALQNGQQLPLLAAALPRALCCADSLVAPPCCAARAYVHHVTCVPLLAGCLHAALAAGHQERCQALATTRTGWAPTTASSRSTAHAWVSALRTLRHSMLRCASPALRRDASGAVHGNRQGSRSSSGSWLGWCCSRQAVGGDRAAPV